MASAAHVRTAPVGDQASEISRDDEEAPAVSRSARRVAMISAAVAIATVATRSAATGPSAGIIRRVSTNNSAVSASAVADITPPEASRALDAGDSRRRRCRVCSSSSSSSSSSSAPSPSSTLNRGAARSSITSSASSVAHSSDPNFGRRTQSRDKNRRDAIVVTATSQSPSSARDSRSSSSVSSGAPRSTVRVAEMTARIGSAPAPGSPPSPPLRW